jgi:hypothetical protein
MISLNIRALASPTAPHIAPLNHNQPCCPLLLMHKTHTSSTLNPESTAFNVTMNATTKTEQRLPPPIGHRQLSVRVSDSFQDGSKPSVPPISSWILRLRKPDARLAHQHTTPPHLTSGAADPSTATPPRCSACPS